MLSKSHETIPLIAFGRIYCVRRYRIFLPAADFYFSRELYNTVYDHKYALKYSWVWKHNLKHIWNSHKCTVDVNTSNDFFTERIYFDIKCKDKFQHIFFIESCNSSCHSIATYYIGWYKSSHLPLDSSIPYSLSSNNTSRLIPVKGTWLKN
jgi:hypothetical protein